MQNGPREMVRFMAERGIENPADIQNLTDWAIGLEKTCHQRRNIFLNGCLHCSVVLHTNKLHKS